MRCPRPHVTTARATRNASDDQKNRSVGKSGVGLRRWQRAGEHRGRHGDDARPCRIGKRIDDDRDDRRSEDGKEMPRLRAVRPSGTGENHSQSRRRAPRSLRDHGDPSSERPASSRRRRAAHRGASLEIPPLTTASLNDASLGGHHVLPGERVLARRCGRSGRCRR